MTERPTSLTTPDFAPQHRQPLASRVVLGTVASIAGSLIADAALVAIGQAMFPALKGYPHFRFSDYAKLTVIGVIIACAGWPVVTRVSSAPRGLYRRLAIVVTLVLWLPDVYILAKGQPARAVGVLMVMHLAIALVTYNLVVNVAPVRPARRIGRQSVGTESPRWPGQVELLAGPGQARLPAGEMAIRSQRAGQEAPSPRRIRRWPQRLLMGVNIFVIVLLIGTGLLYGYARYRLGSIRTGLSEGLALFDGGGSDSVDGLSPENILLIGNETRAGQTDVNFGSASQLTGTLSDIIMILHLNPVTDTASIISIPRDVFVPMPAGSPVGSYQKIDAALNDGDLGPNNLAKAITQDFGIPINHYVEVDFDGFLETVNALGGIKVDFPERLYDAYSGLDITHTGCQLLDGAQALALVRSRHLQYDPPGVDPSDTADWPYDPESDLARIVRDHTFIRILASTAKSEGLTNPLKANAFLGAVLNQLTIDPGLKNQLIRLVTHYRDVNPFSAAETTIPVTQVIGTDGDGYVYDGYNVGDVEFPDQPADLETIERWDPGAIPKPVKPKTVQVYNDVGTYDLAAATGAALSSDGFHVTVETNGTVPGSESETIVQYHPGQLAEGIAVFEKLSGAVVLQSLSSVPSGTVEVAAGSTFAVDQTTKAQPANGASSSSGPKTTTTTVPTPGG